VIAIHIDVPYATTITAWAVLLVVAMVALAGLGFLARRQDGRRQDGRRQDGQRAGVSRGRARPRPRSNGRGRPSSTECARLHAEAGELIREAAATSAKAQRAIAQAAAAEARLAETQQAREAAGQAYDEAQRAYEGMLAAWREGEARRARRTRDEVDESQDREVARAALAAYRRGDLSVDELREVFRRTGGWDPVQEQRERQIGTLRAEAHRAHRLYDAATAAERIAVKAAGIARVAANALVEEANASTREAGSAQAMAEECARSLRRRWPARSR